MCVAGAVFTDRIIVERLTDYMFVGSCPSDLVDNSTDSGIRRIGRVLKALKTCLDGTLQAYYESIDASFDSNADVMACCAPPHLQAIDIDSVSHTLNYHKRLAPRDTKRAVFEATLSTPTTPPKRVVVKFARTYCAEAHELLASHTPSYAPTLLYCKQHHELGGLFVVIMDWYPGVHPDYLTPTVESNLRGAIAALHAENFVFGDLRLPNMMVNGDDLAIIDFDWAGKEGEACYPITINMSSPGTWPLGVKRGGKILKKHDLHMVDKIVALKNIVVSDEMDVESSS